MCKVMLICPLGPWNLVHRGGGPSSDLLVMFEIFKLETVVCNYLKYDTLVGYSEMNMINQHIDGLVQERCNSIANALELSLSCTNPCRYEEFRHGHFVFSVLEWLPRHLPEFKWQSGYRHGLWSHCKVLWKVGAFYFQQSIVLWDVKLC